MNKELIDRAWACLPREFKEKVKKKYARCVEIDADDNSNLPAYAVKSAITRRALLEKLFGEHNLTSDEEGEEMLTVSRKQIDALQGEIFNAIMDAHDADDWQDAAHYILDVMPRSFAALFGSKCLSDKTCNVASKVASSEPAEPKKNEVVKKMKPIKSYVSVYLATKEEDKEFRMLLYENGFMWSSGTALISLSNWNSADEASQIHFVYHDKTVTYLGKRTEETLTFTEFKKRYFGEDVNLSQETVNCDKQFDNILKDGFRDHNRLHIAAMMVPSVIATVPCSENEKGYAKMVATRARILADALISECNKGDKE